MKILQPHKISTEIIDIIYVAKETLVLVSPYVNFAKWENIAKELVNAKNRGVKIDFYVRNEPENVKSWEQVKELGIEPHLVKNLHAKFYYNERNGVISSMNLLSSSNSNSIEIGCKLETMDEIEELKRFVKDFVVTNENNVIPSDDDLYLTKEKFTIVLSDYLSNSFNSRTSIYFQKDEFIINTLSNKFFLRIDKVKNNVCITAIISGLESDKYFKEHKNFFVSEYFDYERDKGYNGNYDTISAHSKVRLSNSYLDNLRVNEKKELISEIAFFLDSIKKFKDYCYENRKK